MILISHDKSEIIFETLFFKHLEENLDILDISFLNNFVIFFNLCELNK